MRLLLVIEWENRDGPYQPRVYTCEQYDTKINSDYHFSLKHPEYLEDDEQSSDYIVQHITKENWNRDNSQLMETRDEFHPCDIVDIEEDDQWILFFDLDCEFEPKAIVIKEKDIDKWMRENVFEPNANVKIDWTGNTVYDVYSDKSVIRKEFCSEFWECIDYTIEPKYSNVQSVHISLNEPVLQDVDYEKNPIAGDGIWRMKVKDWMRK